jgi:hypothetical protein
MPQMRLLHGTGTDQIPRTKKEKAEGGFFMKSDEEIEAIARKYKRLAELFKTLSSPTRLKILALLAEEKKAE